MTSDPGSEDFYDRIPVFRGFPSVTDETLYRPLPDDWLIGTTDVVGSTSAIRANRYKAVNMAGAAGIAAVINTLGRDFPFVFGGDGASFAVPPSWADAARDALAATLSWAQDELSLELRGAMVPVKTIRDNGLDVRVARFAPSDDVTYAMFAGGGLAWAEAAMKRGLFAIPPAPPGTRPDLSGLSCRFEEMPSQHGLVLAILVVPGERADQRAFRRVVQELVLLAERKGHAPVPAQGPSFRWPPQGIELEARASRYGNVPLILRRIAALFRTALYYLIFQFRVRVGPFIPSVYMKQVVANSDHRKFDDALRMIIDCTPELAEEIEQKLAAAARDGTVRFGLHREQAAMMTCFTPFPTHADHMHFVDGATGGYALAAAALKSGTHDLSMMANAGKS
ncbi:DUF3095 domain-containing protein [Pseudorhodoplanes sp.]|uniref:DUF3095 domain-containing protein n=1 Tax=Pseudorhodoplanes sp. TaxID=1934341 RepID=UPI002CC736AC|nr:DUF3095 domain-containing protein [Pseudorhodoplanes sp.]HWV54679.1 DUF3095 domain-containing protein [Pseudorhodoplanes sp.]